MTRPFNFPKEKKKCVFCGHTKGGTNKQYLPVCYEHKQTLKRYSKYEIIKIYEEVLAGSRKKFPRNFWSIDGKRHAKILTIYLIEGKLGLKGIQKFPMWFNRALVQKYQLLGLFMCGHQSVHAVVDNAYPGKFKPWQMGVVPIGYWKKKTHRTAAVRWMIHERLHIKRLEDIPKRVTLAAFRQHHLKTILVYCGGGYFGAIEETYPGRFKPWQFITSGRGFWQGKRGKQHAKEALRWLVEKKLKIPRHEIPLHLTRKTLKANGLGSMPISASYHSLWVVVDNVYPGRFKPWEFKYVPYGYWKGEQGRIHAREATQWLIEKKLKIPISQIPKIITVRTFIKHQIGGVFKSYHLTLYEAIENSYPGRFQPKDFAPGRRIKK